MLALGTTGHRPHRLKVPPAKLAARVRSVLKELIAAEGKANRRAGENPVADRWLEVVSPLAEGGDRIVADEALALGQPLTALLPFSRKDYEATFLDPSGLDHFRTLWKRARTRLILGGNAKRPELAFLSVGIATLARSDVVLTIWDGGTADGRGGTPEILQLALEWGLPIIWIHAAKDRKPLLLRANLGKGQSPQLARAARQAIPFSALAVRNAVSRDAQTKSALKRSSLRYRRRPRG